LTSTQEITIETKLEIIGTATTAQYPALRQAIQMAIGTATKLQAISLNANAVNRI
jgi:flavin-binding protein dodecin